MFCYITTEHRACRTEPGIAARHSACRRDRWDIVLGAVAHRLGISSLVGYLLACVVAGLLTPGFVADQSLVAELAEIGVVLLMFGVGLHSLLKDLLSVRAIAQITVASLLQAVQERGLMDTVQGSIAVGWAVVEDGPGDGA
jgi:CPA2 family monovalent cation:H+ antiporter-2